uniref:Uncharacterized protein LOC117314125 n=1 Tax=Tursiops truncatus TaxID=9739 RepID=A0A6J3S3Q3_TURTR|nr:uncharacterized protein LOC117314125 [Tursiops truncatus]
MWIQDAAGAECCPLGNVNVQELLPRPVGDDGESLVTLNPEPRLEALPGSSFLEEVVVPGVLQSPGARRSSPWLSAGSGPRWLVRTSCAPELCPGALHRISTQPAAGPGLLQGRASREAPEAGFRGGAGAAGSGGRGGGAREHNGRLCADAAAGALSGHRPVPAAHRVLGRAAAAPGQRGGRSGAGHARRLERPARRAPRGSTAAAPPRPPHQALRLLSQRVAVACVPQPLSQGLAILAPCGNGNWAQRPTDPAQGPAQPQRQLRKEKRPGPPRPPAMFREARREGPLGDVQKRKRRNRESSQSQVPGMPQA